MKAAVLIAHYNKNEQLKNTLIGIARQKTQHPFEVCIVDDRSEVDPMGAIGEILIPADIDYKYKRLEKNYGAQYSQKPCYDLVSDDVDTIIIMSCDVIMADTNIIEELTNQLWSLDGNYIVTGDVRNISFPKIAHDFEFEIDKTMEVWDISQTYSNPIRMYLFMTAIKRHILDRSDFKNNNCDVLMDTSLKRLGCKHYIDKELRAVHQKHPDVIHPCSIVNECKYSCIRRGRISRRTEHPQ